MSADKVQHQTSASREIRKYRLWWWGLGLAILAVLILPGLAAPTLSPLVAYSSIYRTWPSHGGTHPTTQGTPLKVGGWTASGPASVDVPNVSGGSITIGGVDGATHDYLVQLTVSYGARGPSNWDNPHDCEWMVCRNGQPIWNLSCYDLPNCQPGSRYHETTVAGITDLMVGDVLEVWFVQHTQQVYTLNMISAHLSVVRVGW